MSAKKILLSFTLLFLCKISFALVWVPEPFAKYNFTKTHYLVSVPDPKNYQGGYTAVFETKTHKFLYKLDVFIDDYMVFLSDNGKQLVFIDRKIETIGDSTGETCKLNFFDGSKITSTIDIYNLKKWVTTEGFSISNMLVVDQLSNALAIFTREKIYTVDLLKNTVSSENSSLTAENSFSETFSEDFMDTDSILSIHTIHLANNLSLKEALLKDLNLTETSDESSANIVIYYILRISKNNTFSKVQIQTFGLGKNHKLLTKLNDEINEKVRAYSYSEHIIPEGVDYWIYDGKIYITD